MCPFLDAGAQKKPGLDRVKLVEWSEQLRVVTSVRLGAVRRRVQIRLCSECKRNVSAFLCLGFSVGSTASQLVGFIRRLWR